MKDKIYKLAKRPFVRNVIILSSGTAAAQMVGLMLTPIITRLYGPEAYGLMGTFMAIISITVPIAALTFPIAIVLPKSDNDAKGLIRLSLYISLINSIILGFILFFFHKPIAHIFNLEEIAQYFFLLPIVILCAGFLQVLEQWLIRTKQYAVSAKVTFLQSIFVYGSQVGIGLFHPVASVLIVSSSLSRGLKAFLMFILTINSKNTQILDNHIEKVSIKELAKKYKDFPIYRAPEAFINAISGSLPILLLTILFGPVSAAFYSIVSTVLGVPTQLIGKSVGDVFYPRISEAAKNGEKLSYLLTKATLSLGAVGAVPYGIVILFGPWLFSFVFGDDWITAGEYARWIALWSYFGFMNKPSVMSLPVLSAQAFQLKFTILMLITRIFVVIIGFLFSSDKLAIALFGVSGALMNIGLIIRTVQLSKKYDTYQH